MTIERFTQLDVWKLAHELVLDVYKFTPKLPKDEIYGISSQMKRQFPFQQILLKDLSARVLTIRLTFII